jgi:hypothetical protein
LSSSSGADRPGPPGDPAGAERGLDERAIDRRLLDLLIRRHGAPAAPAAARRVDPGEAERREIVAQRQRAMAAADPRLIRHIERHEVVSARLTPTQRAADEMAAAREVRARTFAPEATGVREIGEIREVQVPEQVFEAMEHRTPQAFLRDLHRPVRFFGDVALRPMTVDSAASALARVRERVGSALAQRAGEAAEVETASRGARDSIAELRELLARPWEESRPANPLPLGSQTPTAEDLVWWGLSGGYDPDL